MAKPETAPTPPEHRTKRATYNLNKEREIYIDWLKKEIEEIEGYLSLCEH